MPTGTACGGTRAHIHDEHLISQPDLRPVQIIESNLQRLGLGLDRISPEFVRRLHVTARFDDNPSVFRLSQIRIGHLGHEPGGTTDHDNRRKAQQPLRVSEPLLGGEQLRVRHWFLLVV